MVLPLPIYFKAARVSKRQVPGSQHRYRSGVVTIRRSCRKTVLENMLQNAWRLSTISLLGISHFRSFAIRLVNTIIIGQVKWNINMCVYYCVVFGFDLKTLTIRLATSICQANKD